MPAAADHEVIVKADADCFCRLAHRARHVDIGLGRGHVARRMVMEEATRRIYRIKKQVFTTELEMVWGRALGAVSRDGS